MLAIKTTYTERNSINISLQIFNVIILSLTSNFFLFPTSIPLAYPFYFSDYPGYSHVKTKDDGSSAVGEGDEFVTYVFHKKKQVARKWGLR
jgi:hypothetical protein